MSAPGEVDERSLLKVLVAFWSVFVVLFMVRTVTEPWASRLASLGRRIPEAFVGAALCWLMYGILRRVNARGDTKGLLWLVGLSLPLGGIFSTLNAWAIYVSATTTIERCGHGQDCSPDFVIALAAEYAVNFAFVFLAWGALYVGMLASAEALAAERRASTARDEARLAELRALRYQVSPHFLFNCLNSLGTLIDRSDTAAARGMIGQMSSFLRYGLAIDALADVDLEDEVEMQRRYLEIERLRFAHRLSVIVDIDPSVRRARIPSLLLQPIVENAIKHGVATTSAPVTVAIYACPVSDDRIKILIDDDAPISEADPDFHLGIGLRNVRERLGARFEDAASFTTGPLLGGGFRAQIIMPLVRL